MLYENKIWMGSSGEEKVFIHPQMANRHGFIAGATGTGKTVTLKIMAESFSSCGVPVFLADIKGDLAGMCLPGEDSENMKKRLEDLELLSAGFCYEDFPCTYWDVFKDNGIPVRATISEMGPMLLSRILDLNDTQTDILTIIFKIADDEKLLLLDTRDLKSMIRFVSEHAKELASRYGKMSAQSLGAITRAVVALEAEGAEDFFGEPALIIQDLLATDSRGKGMIHILDCQKLILKPRLYATFLLWLMAELFENLPEAGDLEKPKMVFFFDEAHMLFDSAPPVLLERIQQMVKLIRSKGVGIYFITQSPRDIPEGIMGQLSNKIQHALRAYTPSEQKSVKSAAASYRENPEFDTYEVLITLGIGEALISVLDEAGVPGMVKKCRILPPQSRMGTISREERERRMKDCLMYGKYQEMYDRDSAYEMLESRRIKQEEQTQEEIKEKAADKKGEKSAMNKTAGKVASTAAGTIGRELGNQLGSQIGGKFGKRLGGNIGASLGRGLLSNLFKK